MKGRRIWGGALALVVLLVVGAWLGWTRRRVRARQSDLPNILLVTLDTTRADHLSCYGYHRKTTPRLDELAADAMVYDRCISTSSWTLPSHASLLTGRFPTSHGARRDPNGQQRLSDAVPGDFWEYRANALTERIETLPSVLRRYGYATGAVIGGPWLKKPFGLGQGFDYYDDDGITNTNGRPAEQINQRALSWTEKVADQPFLLFLNYFDPHDPYMPPRAFWSQFMDVPRLSRLADYTLEQEIALYDAEIYYTDRSFGKLMDHLKDLGLFDNTWIIVTGDHGELFGEHGLRRHGATLYEPELHVPLIMKYPKRWTRRGRISQPIQLTDIMPTILAQLGLPTPPNVQGTALGQPQRLIFAEVYYLSALPIKNSYRAFYEGDLKYIWHSRGRHMLFDLKADPREEHNLYGLRLEKALAMRDAMDALVKKLPRPSEVAVTKIDPETSRVLRDLGYLTGPTPATKPANLATSD